MDWGWLVVLILIILFVIILPALSFAGLLRSLFAVIRDNLRERMATKGTSATKAKEASAVNKNIGLMTSFTMVSLR